MTFSISFLPFKFRVKSKKLLGKKVPVKILENPSNEIENRQSQVIHDLLILYSIHFKFVSRL